MKDHARDLMAFGVLILFSATFAMNPHEPLIIGALIAAFSTAYGYYLGGSKVGADGAKANSDTLAANARKVNDTPTGKVDDPVSVTETP